MSVFSGRSAASSSTKGIAPKHAVRYLEVAANSEVPSAEHLAKLSQAYAQSGRVDDAEKAAAVATASAGDTAVVYVLAGRAMVDGG